MAGSLAHHVTGPAEAPGTDGREDQSARGASDALGLASGTGGFVSTQANASKLGCRALPELLVLSQRSSGRVNTSNYCSGRPWRRDRKMGDIPGISFH